MTFQLALHDAHAHGLALEWLEVTLAPDDKVAIALLDPALSPEARLRTLSRLAPLSPLDPPEVVIDLVEDRDRRWHCPWLIGSAILTASDLPEVDFDELITRMPDHDRPAGFHDAHGLVAETVSGVRRRRPPSSITDRVG